MGVEFRCLGVSAAAFAQGGAAVAVARAGGIGIADLEFCRDLEPARRAGVQLAAHTSGEIGLRAAGSTVEWLGDLLSLLGDRPHCLILRAGDRPAQLIARLPANDRRRILIELVDVDELAGLETLEIDGLVARGHEAGGWVGQDSSFILLQKLLKKQTTPVFVQGGIGVQSAAACRAGGAAGVVLDDQLLLMPESAMPRALQQQLALCRGQDARIVGERLERACRVLVRPGFAAAARLQELAERIERDEGFAASWQAKADGIVGWDTPDRTAWPVGQAIEMATDLRDRYKTTGRLVQAILQQSRSSVEAARQLQPLAAGAPFAASHGLRYPIVQGPMTRVSDSAPFAAAVSAAGALPFLALALMSGDQVLKLLNETKTLVGDRPWGVGLLGFVPKELRDKQVEAIWRVKPPVALIAGGRPDQAAAFEQRGIATYIHVPSAELLRMFIDQGARRFVFEGRECGGHVGPLGSFVLWETQIRVLLQKIARADAAQVHVLFAGGINDARSAAMVSAMAAPLAERGMRVGVLMGSAYLFTQEIVSTGAIVPEFQAQAISCRRTVNLESGPGHATRCAATPFADEFYAERRRLIGAGASADEVRERLEDMNLGRLRMASKGKQREGDRIVDLDVAAQVKDGMYMIGQVATLQDRVTTVAELHRDVAEGSTRHLDSLDEAVSATAPRPAPSDIAIIGIGTLLPKAPSPEAYWHNIVHKVNAITEVPKDRFDSGLYYDSDRRKRDKIYSKWGGFLDEITFDPTRFGIPPNSLRSIDPMQLLTLEVVRRALEDAGYIDGDFDREHTSVILGASGGLGDLGLQYAVRSEIPRVIDQPDEEAWDRLPEWTEESFPGTLLNVAAGRVANRLDFGGLNFTVDAACASGLAAINLAVGELESGRSNLAIAGGVDTVQSPFTFLCFSKTQALSPQGKARTFDANGDGIVISEGLAVVVLKRLADAERDGDRIYAVVKAVAGSSDGKALGLTAPLPSGQMRALDRAYGKAGFSPRTLGLIEAHGTGTPVGDRAEVETVVRTLHAAGTPPRSCAVGSVKTILGHTKATAGAAGLVKVALALHHRTLPPHVGVGRPLDPIAASDSPVYLLEEARPWFAHPDHPRRAGVSAFGFGGTNFHAVVEEYGSEYRAAAERLSSAEWPCELFVFRAADRSALVAQLEALADALKAGAAPRLRDLAYSLAKRSASQPDRALVATIVAGDLPQLAGEIDRVLEAIRAEKVTALPPNVRLGLAPSLGTVPVAFLFPGQGTQYVNMAREAALHLQPLRAALEHADRRLRDQLPQLLTEYVYPPAAFSDAEKTAADQRLTDTRVAQPAIGAVAAGFLDFVTELGLRPAMTAGHSYGEFAALHAGGMLSRDDFLALSGARGRVMAEACNAPERGAMAAVRAERGKVEAGLNDAADVIIANHNSPQQVVISGPEAAVKAAVARFKEQGLDARSLPVAGAFHSRLMAPVQTALATAIDGARIEPGTATVYSNTTGEPYSGDADGIRHQLSEHLLKPVEFVRQIERMYADGARVFVELGPKSVLSGLVGQILSGREHLAVALDGGGGLRGVFGALGTLVANGLPIDVARLFERRDVQELNLARLVESHGPERLPPTAWLVSGGCVRPQGDSVRKTGKLPALTAEGAGAARRPREIASATSIPAAPMPPPSGNAVPTSPTNGVDASVGMPSQAMDAAVMSPPVNAKIPGAAASSSPAVEALLAYQETMRQFIALQEQVMTQFLSGAGTPDSLAARAAVSASAQPVMPNGTEAVAPVGPVEAATPAAAPADAAPVKAATPSSAPTNGAGIGRAQLTALLLDQVSERTGYPPEMLGFDQDIEAELGIDSIKRVEILGALQEKLPAAVVGRVAEHMETLTRVKTLAGLLDRLLEGGDAAVEPPGSADQSAPAPMPPTANGTGLPRDEMCALLLQQVSERTGYPPEMLALDQDIEAELGIDSIKRVEILGALQERLPAPTVARVKEQMETLTRVKTLSGLLDRLLDDGGTTVAPVAVAAPEPAAPVSIPAIAGDAPDRKSLTSLLLGQVSERTGYPIEMLGLDQDIEAELGIDSIKRVEVLGALQERLPAQLVTRIKEHMESLTRVKTLKGVLDRLLEGADRVAAASRTAGRAAVAAAVPTVPTLDRVALTKMLVHQVSERTGYPPEMLGLDQDIEADLGIDSIKRVEVLGAMQEVLPAALIDRIREQMEALTRVKTLGGLVDAMTSMTLDPSSPPEPVGATITAPLPDDRTPAAPVSQPIASIPRCRIQAFAEPLPFGAARALAGVFLVTGEETSVAPLVVGALASLGAVPLLIDDATLRDERQLTKRIEKLRAQHGAVTGIVHLASLAGQRGEDDFDAWRAGCRRDVKSLFQMLHCCADDLIKAAGEGKAWVVAASSMGGSYGRDGRRAAFAAAGGMLPLLKTARMEWPGVVVRSLDLPEGLAAAEMADRIVDEFRLAEGHFEIGYVEGRRVAFKTVPAPHLRDPGERLTPAEDWVVVITGGARGITAEIGCELARPGMRYVVVGRTPTPAEESREIAGLADVAALRKFVLARNGNGHAPTPAAVEREVQRILAEREIRDNIARLRDCGVEIDYRSVDVRDAPAFGTLLDDLYATYGRIDAVIHGAGVIEDKLIKSKTLDSFERVFDTKVDGAWVLASRLRPESLKLLVFFSSVSGRYGNRGQCDYAAANDLLTRMAWALRARWSRTRVVSISWGPWNAAGMVTDAIKRQFHEQGVVPIEARPGRQFFSEELRFGGLGDVEIVAGAGPWEREPALSPAPGLVAPANDSADMPVRRNGAAPILAAPQLQGDGTVIATYGFSLATHPFLDDHRLDGVPVVPAAVAIEWMAQVVQTGWPDWVVHSIRDVRVLKGIRLEDEAERRVLIRARVLSHADVGGLQVAVSIVDPQTDRTNYKAVAVLVSQMPDPVEQPLPGSAPGESLDPRKAYREYLFHGPTFQLLKAITRLGAEEFDADVAPSTPHGWLNGAFANANGSTNGSSAHWLFDPGLVDAAFQLALVWARVQQGKGALPGHLGAVTRYGDAPVASPLRLRLRISPRTNDFRVVFDAEVVDRDGCVRLSMQEMECPSSQALSRLGAAE